MPFGAAIALLALLLLVAVMPVWPYSRHLDWRPTILVAVAFTAIVVMWVTVLI